eukprot:8864599-Lingulodinium_polyedra.AAC.1
MTARKLTNLDVAFAYSRHITEEGSLAFIGLLNEELALKPQPSSVAEVRAEPAAAAIDDMKAQLALLTSSFNSLQKESGDLYARIQSIEQSATDTLPVVHDLCARGQAILKTATAPTASPPAAPMTTSVSASAPSASSSTPAESKTEELTGSHKAWIDTWTLQKHKEGSLVDLRLADFCDVFVR